MLRTVSVIGGDLRQLTLASLLTTDGYRVKIFGFDKHMDTGALTKAKDIAEAAHSDMIILPLPTSQDNVTINAPFSENEIKIDELYANTKKGTPVFVGKKTKGLESEDLNVFDYFEREDLSVSNAIPTAEGAIEIALSETPFTLHNSRCLVIGYGRIGKILADRLRAFGAKVTVSARKCTDFAWIDANGFKKANSNLLHEDISQQDIIFNTVPSMILDEDLLREVGKNTLIIDLASKPGGVDFTIARELGLKVIWALSLPGKVAPITSGKIIKETIENILAEMEEV